VNYFSHFQIKQEESNFAAVNDGGVAAEEIPESPQKKLKTSPLTGLGAARANRLVNLQFFKIEMCFLLLCQSGPEALLLKSSYRRTS
jgi:hypothetical protein